MQLIDEKEYITPMFQTNELLNSFTKKGIKYALEKMDSQQVIDKFGKNNNNSDI